MRRGPGDDAPTKGVDDEHRDTRRRGARRGGAVRAAMRFVVATACGAFAYTTFAAKFLGLGHEPAVAIGLLVAAAVWGVCATLVRQYDQAE